MNKSSHLNFDLIMQNQAQKEVTVNEALVAIDAILNTGVKKLFVNDPVNNPGSGDLYIVGPNPTGPWSGESYNIAYYYVNDWHFIVPNIGMTLWAQEYNQMYTYNSNGWISSVGGVHNILVPTDDYDNICLEQSIKSSMLINGSESNNGVVNFTLPAQLSLKLYKVTSADVTVFGTDENNQPIQELIKKTNNLESQNWFKTITKVEAANISGVGTMTLGTSGRLVTVCAHDTVITPNDNLNVSNYISIKIKNDGVKFIAVEGNELVGWEDNIIWIHPTSLVNKNNIQVFRILTGNGRFYGYQV